MTSFPFFSHRTMAEVMLAEAELQSRKERDALFDNGDRKLKLTDPTDDPFARLPKVNHRDRKIGQLPPLIA